MTRIKCLLWDFGNTLCDEMFIWGSSSDWRRVWDTLSAQAFDEWSLGNLTTRQFAEQIEEHLPTSAEEAADYMVERCRSVSFFPFTFEFFKEKRLPQAIVTVNPDIFSEVIAQAYNFEDHASVIVTSWQERSLDKGVLCERALERMSVDCAPRQALLIDNRQDCIAAWIAKGGVGYHYTTDAAFKHDVADGIDGLLK